MRFRLVQSLFAITALALSTNASAHFQLKKPAPSNATDETGGKGARPCGPDASSEVITPVTGGTEIDIEIDETLFHPGHYRIALAVNSRDEIDASKPMGLPEPVVKDDDGMVLPFEGPGDSESADIMSPPVFPVLADGLFPHTSDMGTFTGKVAIPNLNCEKCTLQVIQFMAKHGPDYFYRHCADLKITADPNKPLFDPDGMGGTGGMGGGGAGGAAGGGGSGGTGGSSGGGVPVGGTPGTAGTGGALSGSPSGGGLGTAGTGTAGTAGTGAPPSSAPPDEGGCSVGGVPARGGRLGAAAAALLLGLGWLGRRRQRASRRS